MTADISGKNQIDLNNLGDDKKIQVSISTVENADERASRLKREEADSMHERKKDLIRFIITNLMAVAVIGFSIYSLLKKDADPEAKKLASTVIPSLISGFIGYLYGKNSKDK